MSKKAKPMPAPPTVLVITLEADGSGSMLTRRGDLAHLSQFTYRGLSEIITAIQTGATQLADLEQHPPPIDFQPPAPSAAPLESYNEDSTPDEPDEEIAPFPEPALPPVTPVLNPSDTQARLF